MFKISSHDPFEYLKHKLWLKKRSKIIMPIWLLTIKSRESPWNTCVQVTSMYCWKALNKGYNFASDLTSSKGLHSKLWASKVLGVPISRILGLPTWESWDKMTSGCSLCGQAQIILWRRKVVVSPKSKPWWILWVCVCLWFIRAPKMIQLCINQLVVWFVQVYVNNWHVCHSS